MIDPNSPRCECGHRLYDHVSVNGRCIEGTRQCRCSIFRAKQEVIQ